MAKIRFWHRLFCDGDLVLEWNDRYCWLRCLKCLRVSNGWDAGHTLVMFPVKGGRAKRKGEAA